MDLSLIPWDVREEHRDSYLHAMLERESLRREGLSVTVSVSDDGHGGARLLPRGGLAGLTDRVAGSGGRLDVTSVAGRGTTVRAVLPCGS